MIIESKVGGGLDNRKPAVPVPLVEPTGSGVTLPPKEIWLQWDGDGPSSATPIEEREEVCWCQDKIFNGDIKYVRSDSREDAVGKELNVALKNLLDAQFLMSRVWTGKGYENIAAEVTKIVDALAKLNHQPRT